ncbi:MAG: MoaD/ThiS family protein [Opitutales bacterium]|nr:MoaD/ThiS family protein [Opitutales bacterium]
MRILYFSQAENLAGCSEESWNGIAAPLSEAEFWEEAVRRHPALEAIRGICRVARNEQFLSPGEHVRPGDEVAVLPPVSGG